MAAAGVHVKLRPVCSNTCAPARSQGEWDSTSHIQTNPLIKNCLFEETTFQELFAIVEERVFQNMEVEADKMITIYENKKRELNEECTEQKKNEGRAAIIQKFREEWGTDKSNSAFRFRSVEDDDVFGETVHDFDTLCDDGEFFEVGNSTKVLDALEEPDENNVVQLYLLREKINDFLDGICKTNDHKGGWEQSLLDAAGAAIEARKV